MKRFVIGTIMLMGAACVLLLAGGFPCMGAPAVYHSGAMHMVGILAALFSALAGWRIAIGERRRFIGGLLCIFFAASGAVAAYQFGQQAIHMAQQGGPLWFGAIGMGCTATVGLLFAGLFGFFAYRLMHTRLWLAGIHWALTLIALGAYIDYCGERQITLCMPVGHPGGVSTLTAPNGTVQPLPFTLTVEDFEVLRYHDTRSYTLHQFDGNVWHPLASLPQENGYLQLPQGQRINISELHTAPGMTTPFLLLPGQPARLVMQDIPPVREYRATCRIDTTYRGRPETRREILRVNSPLHSKGWNIYLMNYRETAASPEVELLFRYAPGRILALAGMVGLILCTACWCWYKPNVHP